MAGRGGRVSADYRAVITDATTRWMEGDSGALEEYERGILLALEQGDLPVALAAHQKLLVWKPGDTALHDRVAKAIAAARDRTEQGSGSGVDTMALFSGISKEEVAALLAAARPRRAAVGEAIVREGESGRSLFLIVQGTVRVTTGSTGEDVSLAALGAGDFFGEVSLLTGKPRTATVTALTEVELLELDRAAVDRLRASHPELDASLSEFHRRRAERTVEALIERIRGREPSAS
jgi:CRP-like cAMP-binding protein